MLHRRLRMLLRISYYHLLLFGLLPTTMRLNGKGLSMGRASVGYLIYSLCPTVVLLAEAPYLLVSGIVGDYSMNNITMKWSLMVSLILRSVAVVSCYGLVWLQRQRLTQLYRDFLAGWKAHWPTLCRIAGEQSVEQLQIALANRILRMLCVNYGMVFFSLLMQHRLQVRANVLHMLVRIFSMLLFSAGRICFLTLLLVLHHQFSAVQLALEGPRCKSPEDLHSIAAIHGEWLILARRAFSLFDLANASIILNMFAVNVNILYHAVQFGNKTIKSNIVGILIGDALVALNLLNSVLLMNFVDSALRSCNYAGQLIRRFNDLRRLPDESEVELELFAGHLRSNRLVYRICGCVVLDKPASLNYMASILSHVIVMMQFDLGRMHERGLTYANFFNHPQDPK